MSETNDTLRTAASAETPATQTQAEGTDGSGSQQQTASTQETTEKLLAGKFRSVEDLERAYQEAEKLIGRKKVDATEAAKVLGSAKEQSGTATTGAQQAAPQTKAEGQQMARDMGGNQLLTWYNNRVAQVGLAQANMELTLHYAEHATKQVLAQALQPLNDQLTNDQLTRNQERLESAIDRLAKEYDDFDELLPDMKAFLEKNPRYWDEISAATTIREKQEILDVVYGRVKNTKTKNASAAAKAAGAVDAKQRETMKAAAVTNGAGTKNASGEMTPEEQYKAALRAAGKRNSTLL